MDRRERVDPTPMSSTVALVVVGVILLGLALATMLLARVDLHGWNTPVALGIATAKAGLIVLFFMHGRFAMPVTRLIMVGALVWLGILLMGTTDDVLTRQWLGLPGK